MRLSEVYTSTQGEGPKVGLPTTFVRFAGCNLRCPGWACDTQHAIDPKLYRHEWKTVRPSEVLGQISDYPKNVCFTGGEPFLQPHEELRSLLSALRTNGQTVEWFTNGTYKLPYWALECSTFIMDWKLPGSGEDPKHPARYENLPKLKTVDAIKFVLVDKSDFYYAMEVYDNLQYNTSALWYVGAAWGRLPERQVVDWVLEYKLPWLLNVQVHKHIWDPEARRT